MALHVTRGTPTAATAASATLASPTTSADGVDLQATRANTPRWQVAISAAAASTITNLSVYMFVEGLDSWERITAPGAALLFSSLTIPAGERFVFVLDDVDNEQTRLALVADGVTTPVSYRATPLIVQD